MNAALQTRLPTRLGRWLPGLAAVLLLSACGGGGQDTGASATASEASRAQALAANAAATSASVTGLTKLSEKRIGRTLFEYEFRITVQNGASAQTGLKAQLTAAGPGTTIVQGDVPVGDIAAGASITPSGIVTLRQDRQQAFQLSQMVWTFTASGGSTPSGLSLALNQGVIGAGGVLVVQPTVTDASGAVINPPPAVTLQVIAPADGSLGAVPTVNGNQILTSADTRGGFRVQATLGSLVAQADFAVVANTSQSANSGQFADLSANQAGLVNNLNLLRDAVARGDNAAVATLKAAIADASNRIDPNALYFSSPYAPDSGFVPDAAKLSAAGLTGTPADTVYAGAIAQLQAKLTQITALLRSTTGSDADNTALLTQYLADLNAIAAQLQSPGAQPSAHGLVANATLLNRLLTQDVPITMRAIADRAVTQSSTSVMAMSGPGANSAAALTVRALSSTGMADGAGRQPLTAWTQAAGGTASPQFLLSGLLNALGPIGKLIDGMYGQGLSQIQNMMTLLIAKDLLDKFLTQTLVIEGVHSGSSLAGPFAYNYPNSTIELTNTSPDEMAGSDAYLIGASAVNALTAAGKSLQPPKEAKSFKEIYDYFKGILDAIKGVGEAYELAHQLPSQIVYNSFSESFGCLVSFSDSCVEMQYPSGFKNVAGGERFSFTVLILVRSGGPKPKYGSIVVNFVPTT